MWADLSTPWQACLEEAWASYCAGSIPIGAAITDRHGIILARGRNRIGATSAPSGQVCATELAHAELNALLALGVGKGERSSWRLYTTTEPCPLCLGAFYMSGVRNLSYASRDPWAGSVNLLGTTPYLSHKVIQVTGPENTRLEALIVALFVEWELRTWQEMPSVVRDRLQIIVPEGVSLGTELHRSGELHRMANNAASAAVIFDRLVVYLDDDKILRG